MKVFKILLKEIKQPQNKWNYREKGVIQSGEIAFSFKNEELDLKKGDIVYFQDDYIKKFSLEGKEYISTNPANLICQKQ